MKFAPRWRRGPREERKRRRLGRYLLVALGLLLVVGLLAGIKSAQIATLIGFGKKAEAAGPPPESVASGVAQQMSWESTINAVGTVASVRSVEIRNELPGVVARILFDSGQMAKKDQLLVELDASQERSQLHAAKARQKNASQTLRRSTQLVEEGAFARAQLDNDTANFQIAQGDVAALEALVEKKLIRAPFAGRLGIRQITKGQYLETGTRITVLDALGESFVDFPLPQEDLANVRDGMAVRINLREGGTMDGTISALAPTVDPGTRNAALRAHVPDPENKLRPGMFVDVSVVRPERLDVVAVPATAIVHASYGDSVFVLEEKKPGSPGMSQTPDGKKVRIARQQFVRVGGTRGDFVQIQQGLQTGQEIVVAGAFKLRNGSPVVVDNSVVPEAQLAPRPENR